MDIVIEDWLALQDEKYLDEGRAFLERLTTMESALIPFAHSNGILGFGLGDDNFYLLSFALRKDGLRFYADVETNARLKDRLGKMLVGKSCIRLRKSADLDDDLLNDVVAGTLASVSQSSE